MQEKSKNKLREKYKNGELKGISRPHTDKSKKKISDSMKKAHAEGRAHNIGESRWKNEPSYPESMFMQIIENEFKDKNYKKEYSFHRFSFDFAWPHKKKYIEIDSDYHLHKDQHNRDIMKDEFAKKEGWQVIRFFWNDFCKNTKEWINKIKVFIDEDLSDEDLQKLLDEYNIQFKQKETDKINDTKERKRFKDINKAHEIALMINKLIDANIDFTKFGWCEKVNKLLNINCARRWIKRNAEFLLNNENIYQR